MGQGWKQCLFLHKPFFRERRDIKFSSTALLTQQRKAFNFPRMERMGLLEAEHMGGRLGTVNPVIAFLPRKVYRAIICDITMLVSQNA